MVFLFGLSLALSSLQADETYHCRNVRPSHLLSFLGGKSGSALYGERTQFLPKGSAIFGSSMFEDLSAKANDAKREIRLQGRKDSVAQALDMIRLVDVERRKVTATIRVISPIDSLDMRMVSTMSANVPMEFAEPESKTKLTVAIRPNAGESFTVFVASGESEKSKTSVVFRVNGSEKTRLMVANGKFRIVDANEIPSGDIVLIEFSVAPIGSSTRSGA